MRSSPETRSRSGEEGFTLIEIMVASMILLIIISVSGFMVTRNMGKAKTVSAKNQIQIFSMALNSYFIDCGVYPTNDPWGRPYMYSVELKEKNFEAGYVFIDVLIALIIAGIAFVILFSAHRFQPGCGSNSRKSEQKHTAKK